MIQKVFLPRAVELQLDRGDCPEGARGIWKVVYYERGLLPMSLSADDTLERSLAWVDVECVKFSDGTEAYEVTGSDQKVILDITEANLTCSQGDSFSIMCQTYTKQKHSPLHASYPVLVTIVEAFKESGRKFIVLELEAKDEA